MCERLLAFGLSLDRSTLLQYERGTVRSPDPMVLWGLGRLYHVTVDDLVADLVRDRTGRAVPSGDAPIELDADQRCAAELIAELSGDSRRVALGILEVLAARLTSEPAASPPPKKVRAATQTKHVKATRW
jgi:transcriptional regulator with XRE-family HTH domain